MTENTANKKINKFDFVKPAKVEFSSGFSLEEQKKTIEKNFIETKKTHSIKSFVTIISLVALSLVGLCSYTIWQLIDSNNNAEKAVLEKKTAIDNSIIISGGTFSIVLKSNPSVKFTKETKDDKLEALENKPSVTTEYSTMINSQNAGIEVTNTEYDNRLSQDDFTNKYLDYLGSDYIMSSEKTFLQRGFFTNRITPKNNSDNVAFYPVVSSNNYYVIKTFNSIKNDNKNSETSNFVDDLITKIYLN